MSITAAPSIAVSARVKRFGLFEVNLETSELRKNGLRLKLRDQQLHLLSVLLEHPGSLVTREEICHRLWKPDTFVEFDHSLNTAMMRLREILGDSSERPIFIQTVPRKGYRFIAPVQELDHYERDAPPVSNVSLPVVAAPSDFSAEAENRAVHREHKVPSPRAVLLVFAALMLLLVAVATAVGLHPEIVFRGAAPKSITSIAVLPMENLSGDSSQDYFADGMTDELIASLARVSSLRVISRTTAMEYKGTHESLAKIAHDLHVDAVVEGTVLRSGDQVRITAELIQVSTDHNLWAETYESPLGNILRLQSQVASEIVSQIQIKLSPREKEHLASTRPINPEAYEDYLKGRYYWSKRSEGALEKAIQYFQAATEKDPQYALAYAGLADCYGILGAAIVGTVPTSEVAPKAEAAAIKAVALDPNLAETQTALATVQFNYKWNWSAAETGLRRAISLNPSYATAHQRYSLYLIARGRTAEGLAEMNRARSLDPLSVSMSFSLGWRLYMARRYDEAITQLLSTIEMDPTYLLAHIVLGQCYEQKRQYGLAIAELQKAAAISPNNPPVLAALGHVYAMSGDRVAASRMLEELQSESTHRYVSPFYLAYLYAGLGDAPRSIDWLERACDDRSNSLVFLDVMPQFDRLHNDPGFKAVRSRIGL